eukprot:jgi/Ulvmu1/2562/UM014_0013.1
MPSAVSRPAGCGRGAVEASAMQNEIRPAETSRELRFVCCAGDWDSPKQPETCQHPARMPGQDVSLFGRLAAVIRGMQCVRLLHGDQGQRKPMAAECSMTHGA